MSVERHEATMPCEAATPLPVPSTPDVADPSTSALQPQRAAVPRTVAATVLGTAVVGVAALAWTATRPAAELLQGQVEVRRVNVSAKIAGRVDSLLVREGDRVQAGQLVAVLRSPELAARAEQAAAQVEAAEAQRQKARHGARAQEVEAARANWLRAVQAERLAAVTAERIDDLYAEGVVAAQKRDEARTQAAAAGLATHAARAQYELAREGARVEDRAAASAVVRLARGGRAEVAAYQTETRIVSPLAGEISQRTVEAGEVVAAGLPLVTVADLGDAWVTFSLREDRLARVGVDSVLTVTIPALGGRAVPVRVTYVAPVGDYAIWRSTGESGGFDLRTFEVRARPIARVPGLRPGMTVLLPGARLRPRAIAPTATPPGSR